MAVSHSLPLSKSQVESIPKAALLMVAASIFFVIMNSMAKKLSGQIPTQEIAFFRSFVNFVILLPIILIKRRSFMGNNKKVMFIRSILGYMSLFLAFYSVNHGQIAESTILIKTSIIFSALFSAIFLREKINAKIFAASLVGFLGATLIIDPNPSNLSFIPGVAAILSGLIIGLIAVTLRKLQRTDDSLSIVFAFSMWGSLFGLIASWSSFVVPDLNQSLILLATGSSGLIAQFLFTESFKFGPASEIHPFMYSEIIFAIIIGTIFFNESIKFTTILGAVLIVISGISILKVKSLQKQSKSLLATE